MTDCRYIDARLLDWLYDELGPPERASIAEHLRGCAVCRETDASLSWVRTMMRSLPEEEPPAAVSARLLCEAARGALGTTSGASRGAWQRFCAWLARGLQLAWAHPAMAAMATLVLVASVAGALQVRGALDHASPLVADRSSIVETPAAAGEQAEAASVAGARQNVQEAAREREPMGAEEMAKADAVEEEKEEDKARGGGVGAREDRDEGWRKPRKKSARVRKSVEKSAGRPADAPVGRDRVVSRVSRSAPGRATVDLGAGLGTGGMAGSGAESAGESAYPAAAPEPVAGTGDDAAEDRAPDRAERLHASLRQALSDRTCARAVRIASDLRELDLDYYRDHVAGDRSLAACVRAEIARAKRTTEGKNAGQSTEKAADKAAQSAEKQ